MTPNNETPLLKHLPRLVYKILGVLFILSIIGLWVYAIIEYNQSIDYKGERVGKLSVDIILYSIPSLFLFFVGISYLFFGFGKLPINKESDRSIKLLFVGILIFLIFIGLVLFNEDFGEAIVIGMIMNVVPSILVFASLVYLIVGIIKSKKQTQQVQIGKRI
jgi:cell division protein FtsW (lipid II flippase)